MLIIVLQAAAVKANCHQHIKNAACSTNFDTQLQVELCLAYCERISFVVNRVYKKEDPLGQQKLISLKSLKINPPPKNMVL